MALVLTHQQKKALKVLAMTDLAKQFYLSGGTALAWCYLQHRKSEDLDFFKSVEFDPRGITVILKSIQSKLKFSSFDYQTSLNRHLFFLRFPDKYILKLEFTYYPFEQIESPVKKDGLLVDSVVDIAANKLLTIVQNPRGRDYFDLYMIVKKYNFKMEKLRMLAKQKFDWHIDALQLAARLNEAGKHLDDPILVKKVKMDSLVSFFQKEALNLGKHIISRKN